ncbi:hypothetical protein BDW59DRAFT_142548 [Aspergillus cavernicola]|uniref:Protein kinase domain-containing protein n=1 Tax=Aspergillus cavernicola TaxID=176166 RepID=A0ABR4IME4_9EURO
MQKADWANTFFSDNPPEFIREVDDSPKFRKFCPDDDQWMLGQLVDKTRPIDGDKLQVFWLRSNGRRKYVAKVFTDYTPEQAGQQLWRLRIPKSQSRIDSAVHEFDRFSREARAYSHIERFCPSQEQIYFPRFHGVLTDLERSRFSSGYVHQRAIVLEAVKPDLRSRRILAADIPLKSDFFQHILLSPFEHEWYCSLLCDRLRRLAALHQIGITHADVKDCHFRLPGDFYDTVLYDFSESYTFSSKWPFRVNAGKPRPLKIISEGERKCVELQIKTRAMARDLHSYFVESMPEHIVEDALWQPLDEEKGLLEFIILKVRTRPDYFSMPSMNSVFPFLESIRPETDLTWHIRRGRLLNCYESVWASFKAKDHSSSITFHGEPDFETLGPDPRYYLLCLVPQGWNMLSLTTADSDSNDVGLYEKLRQACLLFVSSRLPGNIVKQQDFFAKGE